MSITFYNPCPTSNDLLARLIAEQQVMNNQIIAPSAIDVYQRNLRVENPRCVSNANPRLGSDGMGRDGQF